MSSTEYITHPLIRPNTIEKRLYQETIIGTAIRWSTLVVLPTGVGKTVIAVLAAAYQLNKYPDSKCIMLAPTKPLVLQHQETFRDFMTLAPEQLALITGEVPPAKRQELWQTTQIAFMTPQVLRNDLLAGRYTLEDTSLLVVDEAHRAVGNYAYVFIAQQYIKQAIRPLLLALTASPGSEIEKIKETVQNLRIENIELRTRESPDVKPYLPLIRFEWHEVELPENFRKVVRVLRRAISTRLGPLKQAGFLDSSDPKRITIRRILELQREIQRQIATEPSPPSHLFQLVSHCAALIRLSHGIEQLETQGITALHKYLVGLQKEAQRSRASKAIRGLILDPDVQEALVLVNELQVEGIEHPKLKTLLQIVGQQLDSNPDSRIMVFTRFRETAKLLESSLKAVSRAQPIRFVGQASKGDDKGLSQKEQGQILLAFRDGDYNVLVATSVGEEGLDIQECDLVVFYEAVPSAVRLIQRRGRTGRTHPGRVIVLVALGTRDQGYYWSSIRRETQMRELLKEMQKMSRDIARNRKQATLKEFMQPGQKREQSFSDESKIRMVVDSRELGSAITKSLKELGVELEVEMLEVGDYILSNRVGVEAKTANDFAQSIIDKRLFSQLGALQDTFETPLLLIWGPSLFGVSGVRPEAICGAMASAMLDFRVIVVNVSSAAEAASVLLAIARREQIGGKQTISLRGKKPSLSTAVLQEYIVAGLPGINTILAKRLLSEFESISGIFQASAPELAKVHGIGKKKAQAIRKALDSPYEPD